MADKARGRNRGVGGMSSGRPTPPSTALGDRWLGIARAAWIMVAALAAGLFVASVPGYASDGFGFGQAAWMGAPVQAPAGLVFVLDLAAVLASMASALMCATLAGLLFWRRSDDWMVLFVSGYLLLYGVVMSGPLEWAEAFYPWWPH